MDSRALKVSMSDTAGRPDQMKDHSALKPTLHESIRKNIESRFNVAALVQETSNALLSVQ